MRMEPPPDPGLVQVMDRSGGVRRPARGFGRGGYEPVSACDIMCICIAHSGDIKVMPYSEVRFGPGRVAWVMAAALTVTAAGAGGQALDPYGGYVGLTGSNTSGFFRTEKIGDRYYLVTPDNHAMISVAMTGILYSDGWGAYCPPINSSPSLYNIRAKYNNNRADWEAAMKANLLRWGFNGIGSWSEQGISNMTENAAVIGVTSSALSAGMTRIGRNFVDVWDPQFTTIANQRADSLVPYAASPWRIGAFPDNELGWVGWDAWGTGGDKLPDLFIKLAATYHGKQYWAGTLLAGKYATIADLNAAYGTAFTSFTGPEPTSLINATAIPNDPAHPAIFADKQDFMEAIADQYYRTVSTAMRAKDPNHLVFTSRWAFFTTAYDVGYAEQQAYNERVWKAEGRYCDIIAVNGYPHTGWLESAHQFYTRLFNATGGKPFMITEYSSMANDTRYSFRDPTVTTWQIWCTYPFQRYRGEDYITQMSESLNLSLNDPRGGGMVHPYLGAQWFYYVDEPSLGRPDGEKNNCGLINVPDEIYTTAVDLMASFNSQMYDYLVGGVPIQIPDAPAPVSPPQPPVFSAASATSTLPGWASSNVLDRNPYTVWSSSEQAETGSQTLTVNFSGSAHLLALLVRPRSFTVPTACTFPRDFRIQYNSAGQWLDLPGHVYADYPNPGNAVQYFACASPLTTTGVRIAATRFNADDTGKFFMQIADVWPVAGSPQTARPTFQWSPVSGAASYTLLYSPEMSFPDAQTVRVDAITSTSHVPTDPLSPGLWYWCVRGVTASGYGGKYCDPVPFYVQPDASGTSLDDSLGMENLASWPNTPQETGGWEGTVWAFPDSSKKTEGNSSARVVFTMNSMNKLTGQVIGRTAQVRWQYKGQPAYYPMADHIRFDLMTHRATDAAGNMTVASKFLSLRVADADGQVLADTRIDPDGVLSPLVWHSLSFPLSLPHGRRIGSIELYLDTALQGAPWDQRLTIWIDNVGLAPGNSRVDYDLDFDVDQVDFGYFQACYSGGGIVQTDPACADARLDDDEDVDVADLAVFRECLTGPGIIADPACP